MDDTASNLQRARDYFSRIWNDADPSAVGDLFSPDYRGRDPDFPTEFRGPDGVADNVSFFKLGFPDLTIAIADAVAAGDRVALRWRARGTHAGEFMNVDPFGKAVEFEGATFLRFDREGRICGEWVSFDLYGLLVQLGAATPYEPQAEDEIPAGDLNETAERRE